MQENTNQEEELIKISEDMVGDASQPVTSNEDEDLVMGGKDHVSQEIGNASKSRKMVYASWRPNSTKICIWRPQKFF